MNTNDVLPELSVEEYETLKASIADDGVLVPIVIDQHNEIVDGKARRRACDELGSECPSIVQHIESETERIQKRLSLNCNRRHLTREQKREMIAKYLKTDPQVGNQVLGDLIGVSKNTVDSVREELERAGEIDHFEVLRGKDKKFRKKRRILTNTNDEADEAADIIDQLPETDKIVPFKVAKKKAALVRRQKDREDAAANAPPWNDEHIKLHHCGFQDLAKTAGIEPGSVDVIITDPPYGKDWLDQWDDLGRFAADYLAEGGLLATHAGILYLPQVIAALGEHLTYRWTINTHWSRDSTVQYLNEHAVVTKWLPVLVFSKGKASLPHGFCDTIHVEGQEKEYHDWQQPVAVFEKLLEYFSEPGDLVVDPCGGAFTTAVACHRLKRRFVGCDIDEQAVKIGWARLHDERSGIPRRLPGQILPPRTVEDRPVACTCRPMPKDARRAVVEIVQKA